MSTDSEGGGDLGRGGGGGSSGGGGGSGGVGGGGGCGGVRGCGGKLAPQRLVHHGAAAQTDDDFVIEKCRSRKRGSKNDPISMRKLLDGKKFTDGVVCLNVALVASFKSK